MEAVSFPISREAACCGIYIYSASTRVGMMSKEQLRANCLQMYEDNYKAGLDKRRKKLANQKSAIVSTPSTVADNEVSAGSFLDMVANMPKTVEKPALIIEDDWGFEYGAVWVAPIVDIKPSTPEVVKPEFEAEWVSHGIELYSISVETPITQEADAGEDDWEESADTEDNWVEEQDIEDIWEDEPEDAVRDTDDSYVESDEEDIWVEESDDVSQVSDSDDALSWEDPEELWDDAEEEEFVEDEPAEVIPKHNDIVQNPVKNHSRSVEKSRVGNVSKPKTFADVKNAPKPDVSPTPVMSRVDENDIREFVKSHKLCSESDILNAFPGHDRTKVKAVIKSALRKYRIFEKHGKFTV